jgi:hypothetical protein
MELRDDCESRDNLREILQMESNGSISPNLTRQRRMSQNRGQGQSAENPGPRNDNLANYVMLNSSDTTASTSGGLHFNKCNSSTTGPMAMPGDDMKNQSISLNTANRRAGSGFCMIGLHCCGDLTPTMLKMFCDIEELTCLVCVSCCYHNMEKTADDGFVNFPMSREVADALPDDGADPWWNHFAFRLAAQETR